MTARKYRFLEMAKKRAEKKGEEERRSGVGAWGRCRERERESGWYVAYP